MLDFLSTISNGIATFADFIANLIGSLLRIIPLSERIVGFLGSAVAYLPELVLYYLLVGITITVLYQIIGR